MNSIVKKSVIAFAFLAASAFAGESPGKPEYGAWGIDLTAMDLKVKPARFGRTICENKSPPILIRRAPFA